MTIDEALEYFKFAEEEGFYSSSVQLLSTMTETEIVELAEELGEKGDYYANLN